MHRNRPITDLATFRLLAVLLATGVLLPTVCLLWFMTRAMKNERLAVRERLVRLYKEQLDQAIGDVEPLWADMIEQADSILLEKTAQPVAVGRPLLNRFGAAVIFDRNGQRIYPMLQHDMATAEDQAAAFRDIWQVEYAVQDYARAVRMYEQKAESYSSSLRLAARIGQARCLKKLGRLDEAVAVVERAAFGQDVQYADSHLLVRIADARLMLINLSCDRLKSEPVTTRKWLMSILTIEQENLANTLLPIDHKLFLMKKVLDVYQDLIPAEFPERQADVEAIENRYAFDQLTVQLAEISLSLPLSANGSNDQIHPILIGEDQHYLLRHSNSDRTVMLICDPVIEQIRDIFVHHFNDSDVTFRLMSGSYPLQTDSFTSKAAPFVQRSLGNHFSNWQVELYFTDADVFDQAARRQGMLYWWTGILSIVIIVAVGLGAGRVVGRQIRLNRLKNDFIATVTHELKTPLASMRVLVDTLREGRTRNEQQVKDYLELISRENVRLSRLIDNFLSFSRMERNKQSFDLVDVDPVEIAHAAAEAIQTKYSQQGCRLELEIAESLPDILADFDAMVTVLVNLLDNACKYSCNHHCQVRLRVFRHDRNVCFAVADRGIGLSKRAQRRIFRRFYRVDQSLARQTEGCGLGLSIVQYVVDAHHGSITVDSQPDRGSTFIVIIPALSER